MSLRIITDPNRISQWIQARNGVPARGTDGYAVKFADNGATLLPISWEDFFQAFQEDHLVMMVDDSDGENFHRIFAHK